MTQKTSVKKNANLYYTVSAYARCKYSLTSKIDKPFGTNSLNISFCNDIIKQRDGTNYEFYPRKIRRQKM